MRSEGESGAMGFERSETGTAGCHLPPKGRYADSTTSKSATQAAVAFPAGSNATRTSLTCSAGPVRSTGLSHTPVDAERNEAVTMGASPTCPARDQIAIALPAGSRATSKPYGALPFGSETSTNGVHAVADAGRTVTWSMYPFENRFPKTATSPRALRAIPSANAIGSGDSLTGCSHAPAGPIRRETTGQRPPGGKTSKTANASPAAFSATTGGGALSASVSGADQASAPARRETISALPVGEYQPTTASPAGSTAASGSLPAPISTGR